MADVKPRVSWRPRVGKNVAAYDGATAGSAEIATGITFLHRFHVLGIPRMCKTTAGSVGQMFCIVRFLHLVVVLLCYKMLSGKWIGS
jgi:hypothetical protein